MNRNSTEHVVVIGGGVIGGMCGLFLARSGHKVTIVEKGAFGSGCSHGNCGYISTSHVLPLPQPGAWREALPALLKPNSPLRIRWRWSPALWKWMWKFSRLCNKGDMMSGAAGRHELLQSSIRLYKQLIDNEKLECEWQENGLLFVFKLESNFDHYVKTNELLRREFGVEAKPYAGEKLNDFEPALNNGLAGGWHYEDDCHVKPDVLMASLKKLLLESRVEIVENAEVKSLFSGNGQCHSVQLNGNDVSGDAFVIATGAWSPQLCKMIGLKLPIQPGKGYSITMPHPTTIPRVPMVLEESRVAITPMNDKYRIGSTMEFAGYDSTINPKRINLLKSSAEKYLLDAYCEPVEEEWFGWRPMTWDGKPVIDRLPQFDNVWIAAGHNMLGMSMATGTGRLIQELIDGENPHISPKHFSFARLSH